MAGKTAILAVRIIGDAAGALKAYKTAESAADKFAGRMEKISDRAGLVGAAAGGALTKGLFDAVNADTANRKLAGQLNLGAEDAAAAGKLSGELYADAYGDSVEQVNAAISAVGSTLAKMSDNGGADVERLSKKALDMAGTFDTDVTEAVSSAGILMKTGLAKDADQAFDLMIGSMQKMPKAMQAELLPVMDEYSKDFAALGIDGNTAFGIIAEASKGGAIMMDKSGDALKEFLILGTSGDLPVAEAFKSIGLDAEDMARKLAAGGPAAAEAFAQTVAGLQGIEDPAAQAQAAIALFGTPLEDLGANKIPEFLGAIDPAGDAFDDLGGSADKLAETVNTGPGAALTEFSRRALASLQEIAAGALPVLQPILDQLTQFTPVIGPAVVVLGILAGIVWAVNAAMVAWNAALAIGRGAVLIATGAQWAWNAAIAANPLGVIILLIAGLVAGLIWAYQNVGWFRDAIDVMGAAAAQVWQGLIGWIEDVIGWLDQTLAPVGGIEGALAVMGAAGEAAIGGIIRGLQGMIGWVKDAIDWFSSLFGAQQKTEGGGAPSSPSGAGATQLLPAPGMYGAAAAGPAPAPLLGATAASISSGGGRHVYTAPAPARTVNIRVEFNGLVTDRLGVAREIRKILGDADALVGA